LDFRRTSVRLVGAVATDHLGFTFIRQHRGPSTDGSERVSDAGPDRRTYSRPSWR
jgi:hypothetical protein